ncbi:hypothetical protein BDW66DRAFT_168565 [Aspergillus desertorum]
MAEELPSNLPASSSQEWRLMDGADYLTSYLLESPQRWHMNTTLSEQQGPTSPSPIQNRTRKREHFSEDDDYKSFLSAYPRLYSDLTSERDPFFEGRGMPLNPHNTPISQSGRQSEIGSIGEDKQDALSAAKSVKHAIHQSSDAVASSGNPLTSLSNGCETAWKPPKPPKPPFLANISISAQSDVENIQPCLRAMPPQMVDDRRLMPETPYRSLPSRVTSMNYGQSVEPAVTARTPEHLPPRPKQPWKSKSIVPGRYFPRPFTRQELKVLGIPLNNPSMPFPAPIPTIDKLPLRQSVMNFDWKLADQYSGDIDGFYVADANQATTRKGSRNTLRRIPHKLPSLRQLTQTALYYLIPWKQAPRGRNPSVRTTITVPFASKSETIPVEQDQVSITGLVDGAYVLRFDFLFPLLLVKTTTRLTAAIRRCMSLRIATIAASIVRALLYITIQWLLSVFRVEVAVELRRL